MLQLAPIQQKKREKRDSFLAPNGTYYSVMFPSLETATELVDLGVKRIVSGASWRPDFHEAIQFLLGAGVDLEFKQVA